jgi:hypothetical protein
LSKNTAQSEAVVRIRYGDEASAEAVMRAISPDNLKAEGISIDAVSRGGVLEVRVTCGRGVGSLVATLDDVLSCISAAEKALGEVA